jgi:hypothetical protein
MAIEIMFSAKPFEKKEISDCIADPKAMAEFRTLYPSLPLNLDIENVFIAFPDKAKLAGANIQSPELKNLFQHYEGQTIFISMDNDNHKWPTETHVMK